MFTTHLEIVSLRDVRNLLLESYDNSIIDDEFLLLYNLNFSKNLDLPYWGYGPFNLDQLSDNECQAELKFYKNDVYALADISEDITCDNRTVASGIEKEIY